MDKLTQEQAKLIVPLLEASSKNLLDASKLLAGDNPFGDERCSVLRGVATEIDLLLFQLLPNGDGK